MAARIVSVSKAPSGRWVLTLANGQIWMENEPGTRSIKADQEVTITKRRWRYAMKLDSGPVVAVHRVD